ncbi:MAG: endonuclease domain-containing protein, partial [Fibromonadaceae bacterium]|nr:endonuclease domain-containing protein [Fibromonadaceae bacterium]
MRNNLPLNTPRQAHKGLATPLQEGNYVNTNSLPRNLKLKDRAKEMRKAGYLHEVLFWKKIKNKQIYGLDFHRQQIIGNFIVDFFAPEIGLVIELDGSSHEKKIEYDKERETYLLSLGLKIIHFTAKDVLQKLDDVIKKL